jgi:hypothetical protein
MGLWTIDLRTAAIANASSSLQRLVVIGLSSPQSWKPAQLLGHGAERRSIDFGTFIRIGRVIVPEPLHHISGQEPALGKLLVQLGIQIRVRHGPHEHLLPQLRTTLRGRSALSS